MKKIPQTSLRLLLKNRKWHICSHVNGRGFFGRINIGGNRSYKPRELSKPSGGNTKHRITTFQEANTLKSGRTFSRLLHQCFWHQTGPGGWDPNHGKFQGKNNMFHRFLFFFLLSTFFGMGDPGDGKTGRDERTKILRVHRRTEKSKKASA